MLHAARVLATYLKLGLLDEFQYRAHLYVQLFQSGVALVSALAGLLLVFSHTDTLGGWGPNEVLAVLGVYLLVGGAIGIVIRPSMQQFMEDVRQGTLDYTLTKPSDAQFLVSISQVRIWRLVDVLLGTAVLVVALARGGDSFGAATAGPAGVLGVAERPRSSWVCSCAVVPSSTVSS
jgi:ABC-2 type transport system permease protein